LISAQISSETREPLERYVRARGLKKGFVIEQVLLHHLRALNEPPEDTLVPPRLGVTTESGERFLERLAKGEEPNQALLELFAEEVEAPSDDRSRISSGNPDRDGYFHRFAGQHPFRHHRAVTYVAVDGGDILGFLTVAASEIAIDPLPEPRRGQPPRSSYRCWAGAVGGLCAGPGPRDGAGAVARRLDFRPLHRRGDRLCGGGCGRKAGGVGRVPK
jgi:hypothetical protein